MKSNSLKKLVGAIFLSGKKLLQIYNQNIRTLNVSRIAMFILQSAHVPSKPRANVAASAGNRSAQHARPLKHTGMAPLHAHKSAALSSFTRVTCHMMPSERLLAIASTPSHPPRHTQEAG
jgi:hypothetical protein